MKRALYYSIRKYFERFQVVVVTSEKRFRWYGRILDGETPTNGCNRDLFGKFDNVEDAVLKLKGLKELTQKQSEEIEPMQKAVSDKKQEHKEQIEEYCRKV